MNPIDRYVGIKAIQGVVSAKLKEAELDAQDYFSEQEREGIKSLQSVAFGDCGGEYHRGKTKAKTVIEWNNTDWQEFSDWLDENSMQLNNFLFQNYKGFCEWWFERTGEVPDGISRVEYTEPSKQTAPKLYRFDQQGVIDKITESGGFFDGANRLLLGDGDE